MYECVCMSVRMFLSVCTWVICSLFSHLSSIASAVAGAATQIRQIPTERKNRTDDRYGHTHTYTCTPLEKMSEKRREGRTAYRILRKEVEKKEGKMRERNQVMKEERIMKEG